MASAAERLLALVLRAAGAVETLAVFPALMPRSWMAAVHDLIGLGPFPQGPVVEYLARSLSGLYALMGGMMLVASTDVRRYAPFITYTAVAVMVFGLLVLAVDLSVGMPLWWALGEGPFLMTLGAVLLALQRRAGAGRGVTCPPGRAQAP